MLESVWRFASEINSSQALANLIAAVIGAMIGKTIDSDTGTHLFVGETSNWLSIQSAPGLRPRADRDLDAARLASGLEVGVPKSLRVECGSFEDFR